MSMIKTLALSACALLLIALVSGAASAGGVTLSMDPYTAPELTAPSVNPYSNAFTTTKNKGIGDEGMFYFTLTSPEKVSIWFSGFSQSIIKNNGSFGGALLSICDATCQADWMGKQPTAVNVPGDALADYVAPTGGAGPQGLEPSQQVEYYSTAGWVLPANTDGDVYELCFDGIATKSKPISYTGTVTISGVPEASTWAMILLGFTGLGFMGNFARKRRGADPFIA
jgi:hypothetical protein